MIRIYKGSLDEIIEMMKKDIEDEERKAKENGYMVNNKTY